MATFQAKAFQTVSSSEFRRAKKLADLALKTNVDNAGSIISRGYEQAIGFLQEFTLESGNVGIDAQRLVADYTNKLAKLVEKDRKNKTTVAQFKLDEQELYWTSAQDGDEALLRNPLELVRVEARGLSELELEVQNAIDAQDALGEPTTDLKNYLIDLSQRADSFRKLQNDIADEEVVPGQILKGFGYFIDADQNDAQHRINRVAILPTSNLPSGIADDFHQVNDFADIAGGHLPIQSRVPKEKNKSGSFETSIGGATYSGTDFSLPLKASGNSQVKFDNPGEFTINDERFQLMGADIKQRTFVKGFTGINSEGDAIETYFYAGADGNLYRLDEDTKKQYESDPLFSKELENVRSLSPTQAKNLSSSPSVQPLRSTPFTAAMERQAEFEKAAPERAEAEREDELGFFGRAREGAQRFRESREPNQSFFNQRNQPTPPAEPAIGESAPDLVEQGKSFFRKVGSFFGQ